MKRLGMKVTDRDSRQAGDCLRTCIAMLMGLDDASGVPHFVRRKTDDMTVTVGRVNSWLRPHGLCMLTFPVRDEHGLDWLLQWWKVHNGNNAHMVFVHQDDGGRPMKDPHAIVVKDGEVWCDPAWPDVRGIIPNRAYHPDQHGFWWVAVLARRSV